MIADLGRYSNYKDSGAPWLGEVPEHWEVQKMGRAGRLSKGNGGNKGDESSEGTPCVRYGDLYTSHEFFIQKSRSWVSTERANDYTPIGFGDVLFAASGETIDEIGKSAVSLIPSDACCGGDIILFRPKRRVNPRYLGYLTDCRPVAAQKASMGRGITVKHIYGEQLQYLDLVFPPLAEQAVIARFLDRADRRILRCIEAKEKLVELLEEQRQALVNEAVMGRVDARTGAPHPAYKPSGVEWLGHLPAHWEQCRLKNVVSQVTTGSRGWSSYASETGPLFIRVANLSRGSLQLRFNDVVRLDLPNTSEASRTRIKAGDLLVSVTAYIGSIGLAPEAFEEAYVSQHVARCEPRSGLSPKWLGYVLLSSVGQAHGQMSLYGGTKDGLSLDDVKNYPILLPPQHEQDQLVQWIERQLSLTVEVGDCVKRQIDLLREYRTRLIADVVTGKLDVRKAATELPDEIDGTESSAKSDASVEIEAEAADDSVPVV